MSDDLIKRLRNVGHDYDFHENALIYAAADEIERLRAGYPRLLRVACLRSAAEYMENMEKFDRYERTMAQILGEIDVMDDLAHIGTDPSLEYRDHG